MSEAKVSVNVPFGESLIIKNHWWSKSLRITNEGTAHFKVEHWDGKDWVLMLPKVREEERDE